ncbi:MAG: hypothetical protein UU02_C0024G0008 [Candidatus Woesebacteria bacterium GW2011_GWA1_40_43]|uniref:Uncharacterized protein n=1 Tax=Candidatus Woesebacteria bacterium GW2011_GWA1_40_43 TaxID=1618553 RepID=A0A0G0UUY9_9BACT|nr:MAG: hypothetical protein UT88_C0011G0016 [Candidatus Woesebacteria bacterium GW2011_GWD2_40_19]KKR58341.1 MAG: hypothetical protein UT96_C0007G0008 [Candidatus Woesebacteria bacterium GW2011_GWC2_40_30]KKR63465.1 MAG: hypothetical protein UU02_C0024G0008 [Candidatus Woesebacteria bacterium GW2011_GWA1_40_43]
MRNITGIFGIIKMKQARGFRETGIKYTCCKIFVAVSLGSRLMVGQQPLKLFILGSNPSSPAKIDKSAIIYAMSYDLHLYNEPKGNLLSQEDLKKLDSEFRYRISKINQNGKIIGFYVDYKDRFRESSSEPGFEVYHQDEEGEGYYWTNISYGANEDEFNGFVELFSKIAETLNLKIIDPQIEDGKGNQFTHNGQPIGKQVAFGLGKNILRDPVILKKMSLKPLNSSKK